MADGELPFDHILWEEARWDVGKRLGHGKFAVVHELTCRADPARKLAAKIIRTDRLSAWARAQLTTEVEVWTKLSHPHVCRFYGELTRGMHRILVLEFAEGGELFERIVERTTFSERDASRLMRELLSAVAHMHEQGIIHRDIKPENLLLDSARSDASLRIADFGAAKVVELDGKRPFHLQATTPCGSLGYAAPEQLRQEIYERQCDLWSSGVVAYVLLTGCMPFDPSSYTGSSFALHFPPELWSAISPEAVDFIRRLLQIDPQMRPTAREALGHPWLNSATPLAPLPTPRMLQGLRESGTLDSRFSHANDVWMYSCATTPIGPRMGDVGMEGAELHASEPVWSALGMLPDQLGPEVPTLLLPTHINKRLKKAAA